jgi:hypothetical protein
VDEDAELDDGAARVSRSTSETDCPTDPPGGVTALADALIGVASRLPAYDPATLHARAVERYGFEAVTNRWLRVYDELIAEVRRARTMRR